MASRRTAMGDDVPAEVARSAGIAARTTWWSAAPLEHRVENLTTARLQRVTGCLGDGGRWSVIAKTLQPASSSPLFAAIPEKHHAEVLQDLRWLDEPDVYRSGLRAELPPPLRMPIVHAIEAASDDRVTIWMEDVADVIPWDLTRYRRTAEALGALSGSWPADEASARFGLGQRSVARMFFGKVVHHDVPIQAVDDFWEDPHVAAVVDPHHRPDLARLANATPGLLAALASVPTGVCHGDATPDNFREPGDGTVVALDWSYGHVGPLGSDLGQLLVGRFESGAADVDDVEPIAQVILDGYCEGLARVGADVDPRLVERGLVTHLVVRSVFSALILDHRPDLEGDERVELLRRRARVARFGLDAALYRIGDTL